VEPLAASLFAPTMKDEMAALEERKARLVELTLDQTEEPPMLQFGLAEVYWRKVQKLTEVLNKDELQAKATDILHATIQRSGSCPRKGSWRSSLVGEPAGILALSK
jgi:hypothetical protein